MILDAFSDFFGFLLESVSDFLLSEPIIYLYCILLLGVIVKQIFWRY